MKLLVTGIAGFIGSHLATRLLDRGHELVGLDVFDAFYDRARKEANLASLRSRVRFLEADILDVAALDEALAGAGVDVVVHLAALAGVGPSLRAPARYQRVNVEGTSLVTEAAIRHGVPRIVFASSSSVYGANTKVPFDEDDRVDDPVSPYASSKRAGELLLKAFNHTHGIGVSALRYFTVYGPRQRPDMAIHSFCRAIERGEPVRLRGGGSSSRDYTYVDDVVSGTVAAIERDERSFRAYNLGGQHATSLEALVLRLGEALGKQPRVEVGPEVPGDVKHTLASIERAKAELGYAPSVSLEEGLRRFVAWYRAEPR
jgi:UDP-glucuronate 4-epimerase